jgi:hypothetical protein
MLAVTSVDDSVLRKVENLVVYWAAKMAVLMDEMMVDVMAVYWVVTRVDDSVLRKVEMMAVLMVEMMAVWTEPMKAALSAADLASK